MIFLLFMEKKTSVGAALNRYGFNGEVNGGQLLFNMFHGTIFEPLLS